jgi:predicted nucleic acid-binding Zn ribbon protein
MKAYKIECEECDNVTSVLSEYTEDEPAFCPMCGRRQDATEIEDAEYDDS